MKASMTSIISIATLLWTQASIAQLAPIAIDTLKGLKISSESIQVIDSFHGRPTLGQVQQDTGTAYVISSPLNAQQLQFAASQGQLVHKGDPIVKLTGPEVHHYFSQFEVKRELFNLTLQQYEANKTLFSNGLVSQQDWLGFSQSYFQAKLEYEEMQHFFEWVKGFDAVTETLTLASPIDGYINFDRTLDSLNEGLRIVSIIPLESIRLTAYLPTLQSNTIISLRVADIQCEVNVSHIDQVSNGFANLVWSQPLLSKPCNQLKLGQTVTLEPVFKQSAYLVPKTSVFSIMGKQYVLIQSPNELIPKAITLVSTRQGYYVVTSDSDLAGKDVVTESVSAVQGIMLGLGGE